MITENANVNSLIEEILTKLLKDRIVFFSTKKSDFGKIIRVIGADPFFPLKLSGPMGVTFDSYGNLYVADSENSRVLRMNAPIVDGTISVVLDASGKEDMIHPVDIKINSRGDIAVLDDTLKKIIIYRSDYFTKGNELYKKRKFERAIYYLKKAVRDSTRVANDNIYALFYLGQSYEMLDQLEEAYRIYSKIVKEFSYGSIKSKARFRMKIIEPLIDVDKL
jgi:tetratricopeptide (TPR) repeat protein